MMLDWKIISSGIGSVNGILPPSANTLMENFSIAIPITVPITKDERQIMDFSVSISLTIFL